MRECWGLCLIACTLFCAEPDAKNVDDKPAAPTAPAAQSRRLFIARKRNVRLNDVPLIRTFNVPASAATAATSPLGKSQRPDTAPAVNAPKPEQLPFLDITPSPKDDK